MTMENVTFIQWLIGTAVAIAVGGLVPLFIGALWVRGEVAELKTDVKYLTKNMAEGGTRFTRIEDKLDDHGVRIGKLEGK